MSDKNMADVADKAVDKLAAGIEAVARAAERAAPHVWELSIRQVRWDGALDLAVGLGALAAAWFGGKWAWPGTGKRDYDEPPRELVIIVVALVVVTLAGVGIAHARSGLMLLGNAQYYAALRIVEAAK